MLACSSGLNRGQVEVPKAVDNKSAAGGHHSNSQSVASSFQSSNQTFASSTTEGEEDLRVLRWQQLTSFYPAIAACCKWVFDYFSVVKTGTYRYQYRSLSELYDMLGIWTSSAIFSHVPRECVHEAGYVRRQFLKQVADWKEELRTMFVTLKNLLVVSTSCCYASRVPGANSSL